MRSISTSLEGRLYSSKSTIQMLQFHITWDINVSIIAGSHVFHESLLMGVRSPRCLVAIASFIGQLRLKMFRGRLLIAIMCAVVAQHPTCYE